MAEGVNGKTVIAEDIVIEGTVKCASDIQFDGKLIGDIECAGNAIFGNSSVVKGNVSVKSVTLMGKIDGNINASDRIEMKSTTVLNGDIRAKRLTVEDGVTFIGRSEVNPNMSSGNKPASVPSSSDSGVTDKKPAADSADKNKSGIFAKK